MVELHCGSHNVSRRISGHVHTVESSLGVRLMTANKEDGIVITPRLLSTVCTCPLIRRETLCDPQCSSTIQAKQQKARQVSP
jgi:hypothetical protein